MNKWYMQIAVSLAALVVITILSEAIYPMNEFPTKEYIMTHGDPTMFYVLAIISIVVEILLVVGIVRGILALIRAFRSFVRINK